MKLRMWTAVKRIKVEIYAWVKTRHSHLPKDYYQARDFHCKEQIQYYIFFRRTNSNGHVNHYGKAHPHILVILRNTVYLQMVPLTGIHSHVKQVLL